MMVGDNWGMRPPCLKNSVGAGTAGSSLQPHTGRPIHFALVYLADNFVFQPEAEESLGNFCSGPNSDQLGKIAWQSECDRNLGKRQQRHPGGCES